MADASTPTTILAVDQDPNSRKALVTGFARDPTFAFKYIGDPKKTAEGVKQLKPDILLVHAELKSFAMADIFAGLNSLPNYSALPVVLLAKDDADQPWASRFRSGIVHVLREPFQPAQHVTVLKELIRNLASRTGMIQSHGQAGELAGLIAHVKRAQRSGALTLNTARPAEGTALFVHGQIHSASFQGQSGDEALWAMAGSNSDNWSFAELAGQPGDGAGIVIEVGGDDDGGVDMDVDAGAAVDMEGSSLEVAAPEDAQDGLRVLLVDDDPELCKMFSALLERRGLKVTTAEDGVEGYERARSSQFDVVVADLSMPRLDGWGLLRQIRDDYRTRELPVAFLSCHDDFRESLHATNAGAQAYFSKSVKHDVLAAQIRSLAEPRRQVQAGLAEKKRVHLAIDSVGAQWLVQELNRQKATGKLDAKDDWASYQLTFLKGDVVAAAAQAGPHAASDEPALIAFMGSRSAAGHFVFGEHGVQRPPIGQIAELVERAVLTLNEKDRRAREALLVSAKKIAVDQPLYSLYSQVGPKQWLHTAKLICEDGLPPAEVIAQSDASPIDVEETLKDLIRRGVVTLVA